jgi:hypothetical protein
MKASTYNILSHVLSHATKQAGLRLAAPGSGIGHEDTAVLSLLREGKSGAELVDAWVASGWHDVAASNMGYEAADGLIGNGCGVPPVWTGEDSRELADWHEFAAFQRRVAGRFASAMREEISELISGERDLPTIDRVALAVYDGLLEAIGYEGFSDDLLARAAAARETRQFAERGRQSRFPMAEPVALAEALIRARALRCHVPRPNAYVAGYAERVAFIAGVIAEAYAPEEADSEN